MSLQIREIFLIDDNEFDNEYHQHIIRHAGFAGDIVVMESGEAAISKIEQADLDIPRLVFLDINMPGMDGFEVAERITPLMQTAPKNRVYMLSSSRWHNDLERAAKIPIIHAFITKPLVTASVRKLLDGTFVAEKMAHGLK